MTKMSSACTETGNSVPSRRWKMTVWVDGSNPGLGDGVAAMTLVIEVQLKELKEWSHR